MTRLKIYYDVGIISLAILSISFVILDLFFFINIEALPFLAIDNFILIIFAIDYFYRFYKSMNKKSFFYTNIFDLIAIMPFNSIFTIFRISRIFRIVRLTKVLRITRLIGITGKLQSNLSRFFNTNGFKYLLYMSTFLILFSSLLYSIAESVSFYDALWWAISTTTTVGYGDIYPSTTLGKLAAVTLMVLGIGFIGMLTSSITGFFTKKEEIDKDKQIEELHTKLDYLINKMNELENKKFK